MSDIVVTRWRAGWTVQHPRILFERFVARSAATRRAGELARLLKSRGEDARVVCRQEPARVMTAVRQTADGLRA